MSLRVAVKVAYFNINKIANGFQIQPDVDTIFSFLTNALVKSEFLDDKNKKIEYAGRTDHGVNAISQVISFNLHENWKAIPDRFMHRINTNLPKNIKCWAYSLVSNDFHPRFDAITRSYHYVYSKHISEVLDVQLMKEACKHLVGFHNFINFAKRDSDIKNYERGINEITIEERESELIFTISAKSFLWQQCRRITAHLVQIGKKQSTIKDTEKLLTNISNIKKPSPLPAENLILSDIVYENVNFNEDNTIKLKIKQMIIGEVYESRKRVNSLSFIMNLLN